MLLYQVMESRYKCPIQLLVRLCVVHCPLSDCVCGTLSIVRLCVWYTVHCQTVCVVHCPLSDHVCGTLSTVSLCVWYTVHCITVRPCVWYTVHCQSVYDTLYTVLLLDCVCGTLSIVRLCVWYTVHCQTVCVVPRELYHSLDCVWENQLSLYGCLTIHASYHPKTSCVYNK